MFVGCQLKHKQTSRQLLRAVKNGNCYRPFSMSIAAKYMY